MTPELGFFLKSIGSIYAVAIVVGLILFAAIRREIRRYRRDKVRLDEDRSLLNSMADEISLMNINPCNHILMIYLQDHRTILSRMDEGASYTALLRKHLIDHTRLKNFRSDQPVVPQVLTSIPKVIDSKVWRRFSHETHAHSTPMFGGFDYAALGKKSH